MNLSDYAKLIEEAESPLYVRTKDNYIKLVIGFRIISMTDFRIVVRPDTELEFITEEINYSKGNYVPNTAAALTNEELLNSEIYKIGGLEAVTTDR